MKQHIKHSFIRSKQILGNVAIIITFSCREDQIDEINILEKGVVINEINYNSSDNFDVGDWVEIYNSSDDAIDLSLWLLKDEEDEHIFTIPSNTSPSFRLEITSLLLSIEVPCKAAFLESTMLLVFLSAFTTLKSETDPSKY